MQRRILARTAITFAVLALLAACGDRERPDAGFPSESIRLLVPYAAGGPTDLTARAYGEFLERDLGQPVVVENKPGGSGALATQELVTADPDGHTLALITAGTVVLTPLANEVGYTASDVTPVGVMSEVPSLLAVGSGGDRAATPARRARRRIRRRSVQRQRRAHPGTARRHG